MAKYNEKYFGKNSEVCAVENMLSAGEQIILREKPKRNAYILAQVFKMMPFALLWIVFDGAFIGLMIGFELFKSMPAPLIVFLVVFFAFHLLPVWIWISNVVTAGRRQKNIEYIFTDRRIIIKSGLIGIDVNNVFYADIQNVNLKVGLSAMPPEPAVLRTLIFVHQERHLYCRSLILLYKKQNHMSRIKH